jgi:hypothetical protein
MNAGKYTATFQIEARGFGPTTGPATYDSNEICVTLESDGDLCHVVVSIGGREERAAAALATRIVAALYDRLLFVFSDRVERSSPPVLETSQFTPVIDAARPESSSPGIILRETLGLAEVLKPRVVVHPAEITPVIERVMLGIETGEVVVAAGLSIATKMYRVALESGDDVVSYLILYSALSMMSMFKFGTEDGRGQEALDRWILEEDRTVQTFERKVKQKRKNKPTPETLYTHLRNQFIHAEDREADPEQAMEQIRANLGNFRKVVAGILGKM